MEVFGKFWNIIIGFILMFICPVYLAQMRIAALTDIEVINLADSFLDKVKYTGYIDRSELDNFYMDLSLLAKDKELSIIHRRRAVRPLFQGNEVIDSKEFYIEVSGEEIKEKLRHNNKYSFKIGDEICLMIKGKDKIFAVFPEKTIELGGMIENEYN